MSQIPLLLIGDAPSLSTGLARIGRDLATALAQMPQFRVAYLGRGNGAHLGGGIPDARLPFMQYTYQPTADNQWGARELPSVWHNWANGQRGVVLTIWDPSRLTWFGNPQPGLADDHPELYKLLTGGEIEKWGYFAIDAEGPGEGGALAPILAETLAGYDRVLAYSKFGRRVIEASLREALYGEQAAHIQGLDIPTVDWLPHGYNGAVFQPRNRSAARAKFEKRVSHHFWFDEDQPLVGCVMANQPRKDWGLWARAMQLVAREIPNLVLWAHTDSIDRHWDLRILLDTFGLAARTIVTTDQPSDTEMSWRYSACDLTVLPSLGEGWGYPQIESMSCGVMCVVGNYSTSPELVGGAGYVVEPLTKVLDTRYCMLRPVYQPDDWARAIVAFLGSYSSANADARLNAVAVSTIKAVSHLRWSELWPRVWKPWMEQGARKFEERNGK